MSTRMIQRQRLVRILTQDPDLARGLDPAEAALATRQTVGILEQIPPGTWQPSAASVGEAPYGGLVLSGLLVRELSAGTGTTAELLGAGEVILPRDAGELAPYVAPQAEWLALESTHIAWLGPQFGLALRRWPELGAALLERSQGRADRLALSQAISQLTRVDDRVLILLWHLAERWGRVRADGVLVPLKLTHRVLARLVGARRPSVTTAVNALERTGRLTRLDSGGWLLCGDPPDVLGELNPAAPWRHGRTGDAALAVLPEAPDGGVPRPEEPEEDGRHAFLDRATRARRTAEALRQSSEILLERSARGVEPLS